MLLSVIVLGLGLAGCGGDDGNDGAQGPAGDAGLSCWDLNENGVKDLPDEDLNGDGVVNVDDCNVLANVDTPAAAIAESKVESCATCHMGIGDDHQMEYDDYVDTTLAMEITNVASAPGGAGGFDVTVDFSVTKDGAPYIDPVGAEPSLDSCSFYIAQYDSATGEFVNTGGENFGSLKCLSDRNGPGFAASNGDGTYTLTQNLLYDPLAITGGAIMGTLANGLLSYEGKVYAARVRMYDDLAPAGFVFGDYGAFESVANVAGCQRCHSAKSSDGTLAPYRKHAQYTGNVVDGAPEFSGCRGCHRDDATGGHPEWQWMLDDPYAWATDDTASIVPADKYDYSRTLFNDVHMSHAMELAYPMSMANCATCHEGKLDQILADANFVADTCKSCHAVEGVDSWPPLGDQPAGDYYEEGRPPPMDYLWTRADVTFHDIDMDCQLCHAGNPGIPTFADLHTGYDPRIYMADGTAYKDVYSASIDAVTVDTAANTITVEFSATDPAIVPALGVGFYGWGSKDFLVAQHTRGVDRSARMEYTPESSGGDPNPLFTEEAGSGPGAWVVTLDYAAYQAEYTDSIPDLIAAGTVRTVEVTLEPELAVDGLGVALNAVNQTVDVATSTPISDYYKAGNAIADVAKCNNCHDQLAVTFHYSDTDGSGRGGSITQCRSCHVTTSGGSHLEMQSRSLSSYVHAIHTFQAFDTQNIDFTDPVEKARYELHIEEFFPVFTAQSCEACHTTKPGVFNVPDQSKSMAAMLSAAREWNVPRNIGAVPSYVTGPASMACGGCHRATFINEDAAGELASWNAHTQAFGTLVTSTDQSTTVYGVITKIMDMFQ